MIYCKKIEDAFENINHDRSTTIKVDYVWYFILEY